jgi:hypothetical protein
MRQSEDARAHYGEIEMPGQRRFQACVTPIAGVRIAAPSSGWLHARSAALDGVRSQRPGGCFGLRDGVDHPQVGAPELR